MLNSRQFFLNPLVFYYPGQENLMADNASWLFNLPDTPFIAHMYHIYPHPQNPRQIYHLILQLLSFVISTLCTNMCERGLLKMRNSRGFTGSWPTSDSPCWSTLLSMIHSSLKLISYRCTDTWSCTINTPSDVWNELGNSQFISHGDQLESPNSWMASLTQ